MFSATGALRMILLPLSLIIVLIEWKFNEKAARKKLEKTGKITMIWRDEKLKQLENFLELMSLIRLLSENLIKTSSFPMYQLENVLEEETIYNGNKRNI